MKHKRGERIRWDPIVVKLAEKKLKREFWTRENEQHGASKIKENVPVSQERRSQKEFEAYLKSLFDNNPLQVKYRNPDAWNVYSLKRKDNNR